MSSSVDEEEMREELLAELSGLTDSEAYFKILTIYYEGVNEDNRRTREANGDIADTEALSSFTDHTVLFKVLKRVRCLEDCLPTPVRIMEFGGGTGAVVKAICQNLDKQIIVSVVEPHKESLEQYKKCTCIEGFNNASLDVAYPGSMRDYFEKSVEYLQALNAYPQGPQDVILATHVLYHLSSVFDLHRDPFQDIALAVSAMYGILRPGGELLLALEEDEVTLVGHVSLACVQTLHPTLTDAFRKGSAARKALIYEGGIASILNTSFPTFRASMSHEKIPRYIYTSTLAETGALGSLTYFNGLTDDLSPLDQRVIPFCIDHVKSQGQRHGLAFVQDTQDKRGLWRFPSQCHFISIRKEIKSD